MKVIKRVIEYLIAISVIPTIALAVVHVTKLKDVINVQYELLSEEDGIFYVTPGTYEKLVANKRIKNYELESNYPLITQKEMDRGTWKVNDNLKNEIYIDENGEKRIRLNVGQVTFDGSEKWYYYQGAQSTKTDVATFFQSVTNIGLYSNYSNLVSNYFPFYYNVWNFNGVGISNHTTQSNIYINILKSELENYSDELSDSEKVNLFKQWLQTQATEGNPLTVTYELAVKNPKEKVIEESDVTNDGINYYIAYPTDYLVGGNSSIDGVMLTDDGTQLVYPMTNPNPVGQTLIYELSQPRPVEVYDYSKFRLTYDKNRIRIVFDIDDKYYLWEITKDDRMIPINGQYDLGNIWTVKFYVYEIQQPLIRLLVLLIPLIVVSGLLVYMMKKKDLSF